MGEIHGRSETLRSTVRGRKSFRSRLCAANILICSLRFCRVVRGCLAVHGQRNSTRVCPCGSRAHDARKVPCDAFTYRAFPPVLLIIYAQGLMDSAVFGGITRDHSLHAKPGTREVDDLSFIDLPLALHVVQWSLQGGNVQHLHV
ncbi:hypothetical protein BU26DRAFT_76791 [Trematosphaeria pertusa]|uniref:Uncharacterized protein n=1 Tax=Trematosphaeria pertusa TaxID=390896 RepID=A0A6A6I416_9PLEO|nr:uncharacterized protein BU26DRAFT_76791 [Trematosphaeria pertusa]KAF2245091.1 hypothetical protein BU26DRAFT_76791 [Trematosphaeria pertusa]